MKILDIITGEKPSLSFEVFPPKTSATYESVRSAAEVPFSKRKTDAHTT